jgi:hypothetical protein
MAKLCSGLRFDFHPLPTFGAYLLFRGRASYTPCREPLAQLRLEFVRRHAGMRGRDNLDERRITARVRGETGLAPEVVVLLGFWLISAAY